MNVFYGKGKYDISVFITNVSGGNGSLVSVMGGGWEI